MGLTERDIHNLAVEVAEFYQRPLVERVPVTGSPVRRTVREKQKVTRPVTQTIEIDKGPAPWVWIILFVGWGRESGSECDVFLRGRGMLVYPGATAVEPVAVGGWGGGL